VEHCIATPALPDRSRHLSSDRTELAAGCLELVGGRTAGKACPGSFDEQLDGVVDGLGQATMEQIADTRGDVDVDAGEPSKPVDLH
jgi:hypothetical protein